MAENNTAQEDTTLHDLIEYYAHYSAKPILDDEAWRIFGFSHSPKHGTLIRKLMRRRFAYEDLVTKTLWLIALSDVTSSIRHSSHSSMIKYMLLVGTLDRLLSVAPNLFDRNTFVGEFIVFCRKYAEQDNSSAYRLLLKNAHTTLSEKDLRLYTAGIIKLMSAPTPASDGLMLDIATMIKRANSINPGVSRLGLDMGVEYFEPYTDHLMQLID